MTDGPLGRRPLSLSGAPFAARPRRACATNSSRKPRTRPPPRLDRRRPRPAGAPRPPGVRDGELRQDRPRVRPEARGPERRAASFWASPRSRADRGSSAEAQAARAAPLRVRTRPRPGPALRPPRATTSPPRAARPRPARMPTRERPGEGSRDPSGFLLPGFLRLSDAPVRPDPRPGRDPRRPGVLAKEPRGEGRLGRPRLGPGVQRGDEILWTASRGRRTRRRGRSAPSSKRTRR